ncbi:MAG: polyphosphate polymerase domain-containing protein [bacterium]
MNSSNYLKRKELKYKLNYDQYIELKNMMESYMCIDKNKKHKISNIYFDTADYKVIIASMEKPIYKEKLRIRKYSTSDSIFIELKKKYKGIVYKKRVDLDKEKLNDNIFSLETKNQTNCEINHFLEKYEEMDARVYLSYDREAYFCKDDDSFRMTFDSNILFRDTNVSLELDDKHDLCVLEDNVFILEVKAAGSLPAWLISFLSEKKIYRSSFSKYAEAYKKFIFPKLRESRR